LAPRVSLQNLELFLFYLNVRGSKANTTHDRGIEKVIDVNKYFLWLVVALRQVELYLFIVSMSKEPRQV